MSKQPVSTQDIANAIISELDHFQQNFKPQQVTGQHQLLNEPSVGYVVAQNSKGERLEFFICRHYTPVGYSPSRSSIEYAGYLSPLGRIIAKKPGDGHSFSVSLAAGLIREKHDYRLQSKDEFRPQKEGHKWDAVDNQMAWIGGRIAVRSLRKLLEGTLGRIFQFTARAYQEFRELPEIQNRFFDDKSEKPIRDRQLSETRSSNGLMTMKKCRKFSKTTLAVVSSPNKTSQNGNKAAMSNG